MYIAHSSCNYARDEPVLLEASAKTQKEITHVLRSQNRTRDLSITIAITVERDKPTTPSGVICSILNRLVLVDE